MKFAALLEEQPRIDDPHDSKQQVADFVRSGNTTAQEDINKFATKPRPNCVIKRQIARGYGRVLLSERAIESPICGERPKHVARKNHRQKRCWKAVSYSVVR